MQPFLDEEDFVFTGHTAKQYVTESMMRYLKTGKPKLRYHSYPIKGRGRQTVQAWLGLYAFSGNKDRLRYFKIDPTFGYDAHRACRAVQGFLLVGTRHFDRAPTSLVHPGNVSDAAAWAEAREQVFVEGLPICFVTFGQRESAIFHYTRLIPPQKTWFDFMSYASRKVLERG